MLRQFRFASRKRLLTLTIAVVATAALAACGGDDAEPTPAVTPTAAAATETAAAEPTPAPAFPLTITDSLGRSVTIPAKPERVVAMSPSVVETLFALGVTPVGRPETATYPPEAQNVESFGTSYQPNLERIAGMRPDLVIADATIQAQLVPALEGLGAPVVAIDFSGVDRVIESLRTIGRLVGVPEKGEELAKEIEDRITAVTRNLPAQRPKVVAIIAAGPEQYFAAKPSSYIGTIIEKLGAENIVSEDEPVGRVAGYTNLSQERLVQANPDVIIFINPVPGAPPLSQTLRNNPAWAGLKAFQEGRVFDADPVIYVQSAGPRVVQAIDELAKLFYPSSR
jgi:iron complex transport system substrate-binding protein